MRTKPSEGTRYIPFELARVERALHADMNRAIGRQHFSAGHKGSPHTCRRCLADWHRQREQAAIVTETAAPVEP